MKDIEKLPIRPFTRFCMSIGAVPSSYLAGLSVEEQLLWLCSYLEKEVIPAVNNNGEAVEELQNLFVELKTYADNYFENLDVQKEINNKLDEMVSTGELQYLLNLQYNSLRNEVNEDIEENRNVVNKDIEEIRNVVNEDIEEIRNVVTNVASGSPLVASSTSEMTDTSRIYVNTTDGKWYYYNGTSWQIGGDYQSSGIGDGSISFYKLNDLMQSNFNLDYGQPLNLGSQYAGYYTREGTLNADNNYINFQYALENGKTYIFTGRDSSFLQSIIIKDNSNNLIYVSNPNNQTKNECLIFECKENNLTAYMSISKSNYESGKNYYYRMFKLRELKNIYNNLKYNNTIPTIETFTGFLIANNLSATPSTISFNTSDTNGEVKIYQMNKGLTYNITGWNYSNICGLLLLDNLANILYASSTENIGSTRTEFNYQFTADKDGVIILTTYQSEQMPTSIELVNDNVNIILTDNPLYGKKMSLNGDSICAGAGYTGGYGKIIGEKYNMTIQNIGVGGGTIASNTYLNNNPRHWINATITNMSIDSDYAIVEGGVNDSSLGVPLGTISNGYDEELDTSTYIGAFENMLKQLVTRFAGKKYGYIAVHQMTNNYRVINDPNTSYYYASKKCCEKWGVPFLDLNDKVPPFAFLRNTSLSSLPTTYTKDGDGWHPNELGYKKYYVDKIINWLESL